MRHVPLMVLIYEAVRSDIMDYDYAPQSEKLGTRRIYLNISQV